jgi:hypothetical protein
MHLCELHHVQVSTVYIMSDSNDNVGDTSSSESD